MIAWGSRGRSSSNAAPVSNSELSSCAVVSSLSRSGSPNLSAIDADVVFVGHELAMVASQIDAVAPELMRITLHFTRVSGRNIRAQVATIREVSRVRSDLLAVAYHVAMIATQIAHFTANRRSVLRLCRPRPTHHCQHHPEHCRSHATHTISPPADHG